MILSAGPRAKHISPRAIYALGRAPRRMHAPLAQPPACACACACWCSPHALLHPPPAAALGDAPYADRGQTARRMHAQTRDFARRLGPGFEHARAAKVQACVQNSIGIMNDAAGDDWGELFVLRLRDADSSDAEDDVYTLEFCSRVDEYSDSESVSGLNTANTVASRLNVSIAPSDQHVLLVDMEEGNTVICLRCMHLATLLRACALLIAQQLVCLCSGNETVGLTGICSAPETRRIYQRIFQNFETVDFVRSVDMCIGTLRNESAEQVPQSLVAVADMLWTWYDKSAFMFDQPLALQIKGGKTRACECGASRELPHVATEPSVHAAGGQLVHLRHLCAAAKLTETPYSSADETTETFTNQLRLFGNNVAAQDPTVSVWSAANIAACVEHAVSLIDSAAGENWGELFRLNVRPPDILNPIVNVFLLQFSSNMQAKDDEFIPPIKKVEDAESVVARLVLRIRLHEAPTPHKVSVSMASGQTAVCVRCMHLATLLRACALLVAQQIAYLGSPADSVLFKGDPVSEGTRVIYSRLCRGLDTTQRPNADDSCYQIAARLRNPGTDTIPQSVTNVSEQLWRWYDKSAFMCRRALPAQIRAYKAGACECGTQRKTPHVFPGYQGVQVHGEHAQACAHPAHLCAVAALPHEPYSSPQETAETLTGRLSEFGDECKQAAAGGSAWSWENIRACVQHAVLVFDDVAGAHWSPMVQLSTEEVEPIEANTLIYYLQFEGKAVLPDDAYQPFSLIPSDQCVLSRLKLVIKEAHPAWFTPSEYTKPLPKCLVSMDKGSTVSCVRQMHLATLLRACALLVAQQIACLGTARENISFQGIPMTEATDRIYAFLFQFLRGPTLRPLPTRHRDQVIPRAKWHAQLENVSSKLTPRSIVNVVNVIWTWYENKAWMYNSGPLPAQIRHASASPAPVCVAPEQAACHRAPAQALTSEHRLYQYRGYRPYQLKLPWPMQLDEMAWDEVLTYFHKDKAMHEYTYGWWLRFHILWETAWASAVHRGHTFDVDALEKKLRRAIENRKIKGGTVGSVLSRWSEFAEVEPHWSLNTIVQHYDFIIEFGMYWYAAEQSGFNPNDDFMNPMTHLFYVLLLSCKDRWDIEELRTIHKNNINDADWCVFSQRVATGMQRLAATAEHEGGVRVSDLWRLLEPDALVHANPNPRAHKP